jgi:hypothetical protein
VWCGVLCTTLFSLQLNLLAENRRKEQTQQTTRWAAQLQPQQLDQETQPAVHLVCPCASNAVVCVTLAIAGFWAQPWGSSLSQWRQLWSGQWVRSCTASDMWRDVASWLNPLQWSTLVLHPACPSEAAEEEQQQHLHQICNLVYYLFIYIHVAADSYEETLSHGWELASDSVILNY